MRYLNGTGNNNTGCSEIKLNEFAAFSQWKTLNFHSHKVLPGKHKFVKFEAVACRRMGDSDQLKAGLVIDMCDKWAQLYCPLLLIQ